MESGSIKQQKKDEGWKEMPREDTRSMREGREVLTYTEGGEAVRHR